MAGKDYKVQKKAKEQQRLSVFQPAFRWGGSSASAASAASSNSSSSSNNKIEAKKDNKFESRNQRVEPRRQDKLHITNNERVEPRRSDNRLAPQDDLDAKMARDAKRMTTFQPIFGSLFSSKASSKGKSPEPSPAQRPPPPGNGFPSQQPPSSRGEPSHYAVANNASGSSRDGRTGPGKAPNGLRIDTQQSRGTERRRDDAASGSRSGRGVMPRSPLQRNPPSPMPEDQSMPLGIINAFGPPPGGSKAKAVAVSNVSANSADPRSTRNGRPQEQDRSMAPDAASRWAGGQETSAAPRQKIIGVDTSRHPAVQREVTGNDFHRHNLGAENQVRLVDTPKRKPVVPEKATQFDSRTQQQPEARGQPNTQPPSRPGVQRQGLPQLIITDTSDASSSTYPSRKPQPSQTNSYLKGTQSTTSDAPQRAQLPSAASPAARSISRSPLEQDPATSSSSTTRAARDASPSPFPDDPRKPALPKQVTARDGGAKRSQSPLRVFPKQQPSQDPEGLGIQSETSMWKTWSPLRPALHREESPRATEQTRRTPSAQAVALSENRPSNGTSERFGSFQEPVGASRAFPGKSNAPFTPAPQPTSTPRGPSHISTRSVDTARPFANTQRQNPLSESERFSPSHRVNRSETSVSPIITEKPGPSSHGPYSRDPDPTRRVEAMRSSKAFEPSPLSSVHDKGSKEQLPSVQVPRGNVRDDQPSRTVERSQHRKNDGSHLPSTGQSPGTGAPTTSSEASGSRQPKQKSIDLVSESNILEPLRSKFNDRKRGTSGSKSAEKDGNLQSEHGVKPAESGPNFSTRSKDPAYLPSLPSNTSAVAPQDELFLGVSKPTLLSAASPTNITTPTKPSQAMPNTSSSQDVKPQKAGGGYVPTNRPPPAMRSITERTEPDAYEFIPVVAHLSPKYGGVPSVAGQVEVSPPRTAGPSIMDRPRGVVKQRVSRADSNTPLETRPTNESSTRSDDAPSRAKGRVSTEQADTSQPVHSANVSRGRPDADQNGRGAETLSRKVQWTDQPRDLIIDNSASSTAQPDVARDIPTAAPEVHAQKSASLGRWAGKGKTPEPKNRSPAPELADAPSSQASGLIGLSGNGESRPDQLLSPSSHQVGDQQKSGEMPGRRIVKESRAAAAEPTQRPGLQHRGPVIDASSSAGSRAVDIKRSDVTSPQPTEEDFFRQMRQSVMFQNIEPAGKADLSTPTDASVKRKSRRNRNISISGLQPGHDVPVPELPTISHAHAWSTSTSGDEAFSAVPQGAVETPSSSRGIREESRTPVVVKPKVSRDVTQPSSSNAAPFALPARIRLGVDDEEASPDRSIASRQPLRRQAAHDDEIPRGLFFDRQDVSREKKTTDKLPLPHTMASPEILAPVDDLSQGKATDISARDAVNVRSDNAKVSGVSDSISDAEKNVHKSLLADTHSSQASVQTRASNPSRTTLVPGHKSAKGCDSPLSKDSFSISSLGSAEVPLLVVEDGSLPVSSQEKAAQHSPLGSDHSRNMPPASHKPSALEPLSSTRPDERLSTPITPPEPINAGFPAVGHPATIESYSPALPKGCSVVEQSPVMQTAQVSLQAMETAPDRTPSPLAVHGVIERANPSVEPMPSKNQTHIRDRASGGRAKAARYEPTEHHLQTRQSQSPQDHDAILSSISPPQAADLAASPQTHNVYTTDHIVSLYDSPDHLSTGVFPDHRSGTHSIDAGISRGHESPVDSRRFSTSSMDAMDREATRTPAHSVLETFPPSSSVGSPAAKDSDARSPSPALMRSIHTGVLSDQAYEKVPLAVPALENTSGAKNRLRKMKRSEGTRDNHAQPTSVSSTPVYSPEALDGTSMSRSDDGTVSRAERSPEPRPDALADDRNAHQPHNYASPEPNTTPAASMSREINDVRSESAFDKILLNEAGPATYVKRTFSPEIAASPPRNVANSNDRYEPYSTDLASPPFESRSSNANLQQSWTPRQADDVATRPLSPEANSIPSSPPPVEGTYSGSNGLSPKLSTAQTPSQYPDERVNQEVSSRDVSLEPIAYAEKMVPSRSQSHFSPSPASGAETASPRSVATAEKQPVRELLAQPDHVKDHNGSDNPSEQVLSSRLEHRSESGRTLSPNMDAGQTSPLPVPSMRQVDDIPANGTHSVASDDQITETVSPHTSFAPEAGYRPEPLRTAQDLGNTLESRSRGAEVVHDSQGSPIDHYNTASSSAKSENEAWETYGPHSRVSSAAPPHEPETVLAIEYPSAQHQDKWGAKDNILLDEPTSPDLTSRVSGPVASPDLEMHDNWLRGNVQPLRAAHADSPRIDNIGDRPLSAGPLAMREAVTGGSPVDASWANLSPQIGRHSPVQDSECGHSDEYPVVGGHDRNHASSVVYSAGIPPDTTYGNEHDQSPVGHLDDRPISDVPAASYQRSSHDYGDSERDRTPVGGYQAGAGSIHGGSVPVDHDQDNTRAFDSDRASYSALAGDHQPSVGGRDSVLDEYSPVAHHRINSPAYSDNDGDFPNHDYQPSAAAFDSLQSDARPADNYHSDALPSTNHGDGFTADNYQPSTNGLDNDHEDSVPDDYYRGGPDDLPINEYPKSHEPVDSPLMDSYPAEDSAVQAGGFGTAASPEYCADECHEDAAAFDGLPAGDYPDSHRPASSPVMDSYPSDNFEGQVGEVEVAPTSDPANDLRGSPVPMDRASIDSYPTDDYPSGPSGFGGAEIEKYPDDHTPNYSNDFAGPPPGDSGPEQFDDNIGNTFNSMDGPPPANGIGASAPVHDDAPYDGAPISDADPNREFDHMDEPLPTSFEQDADMDYPADGIGAFPPADNDAPHEEMPFSDAASDRDMNSEPEPNHLEHLDDGKQYIENDMPQGELHVDDQEDKESLIESRVASPEHSAGEEADGQIQNADDIEDVLEYDPVETDNYEPAGDLDVEGGAATGDEPQPCDAGWVDDELDDQKGHEDAKECPMDDGGDAPMGGDADEYLLGGPGDVPVEDMDKRDEFAMGGEEDDLHPVESDNFPSVGGDDNLVLGGEAEDYLLGGVEEPQMDPIEYEEPPREHEDEELPIGDMYVGEERSMSPAEENYGEPIGEGEDFPMIEEDEEYPLDEQDDLPVEEDESEGSGRGIDEYAGEEQLGEEMLEDGSEVEEELHSELAEGSVGERGLDDDANQSDIEDVQQASDCDKSSDVEVASDGEGETEVEDRDLASSDIDEIESQGDPSSHLAEDSDGEGGGPSRDDLDDADAPAPPASPTLTEADRELTTPIPITGPIEAGLDEDSIFPDPAPQQDPPDLGNAAPVRLSCLYTQDLGLDFLPSAPASPQAAAAFETGSAQQQEEEEDDDEEEDEEIEADPVRFSTLYRSSLALESFMWEEEEDSMAEEDDAQQRIVADPIPGSAEESAIETNHQDLQALEVDHGQTPTAAPSPLSPRPLATPPPDLRHATEDQDVGQWHELPKDVGDTLDQPNASSPRLQPTPPPESARASSPGESDAGDRRDSKRARTFDEMNLPQRVISPPNAGDEQEDAAQASAYGGRRSISQRVSGWFTGGTSGSSAGQGRARPPPLPPTPYDSRYGEQESP